jgi:ribulose-5-phosphate 4-epimerase/fuculose-1-phosphate aldolase
MAGEPVFRPIRRRPDASHHPLGSALVALARTLHAQGLTPSYGPGDHGNLSCRTPEGCLITARETHKAALREDDLVRVVGCDRTAAGCRIVYDGPGLPSTDALMHLEIYARRPEITAIVHAHDERVLARASALGIPATQRSAATSSLALIEEVAGLSTCHDYLILRGHGVLALGRTIEAAAARLQHEYRRARAA